MSSSNLENNKIFAAVLVAGIVVMLSGFFADRIVHSENLEEEAFPIEVAEADTTGGAPAAVAVADPIDGLIAAADIDRGQKLSKACAACHSFDKGGANKIGPNLFGVFGAGKGKHAGFSYSDAMVAKGGSWDVDSLNQFLWKPKKYIAGTKMNYAGLKKAEDRAAIVKYLQSLK